MSLRQELATLFLFIVFFAMGLSIMNRLLLPHGMPKLAVLIVTSIIVALLTISVRYEVFYRRGFLR